MIESPFNYTGGKFKLLSQIFPLFPTDIKSFYDIFCGGCNVGINVKSNCIYLNDNNDYIISLLRVFRKNTVQKSISSIEAIIANYGLSDVKKNGYDFYGCNSSDGLAPFNAPKFKKLKNDFNYSDASGDYYYYMFYVLIVYSFNNQIRFNSKKEFNLPCGKRDFNGKMRDKLIAFITELKSKNIKFSSKDFRKINFTKLDTQDFVYADPPYLITCATYNESNGWTANDELDLLKKLDGLNRRGIRFALSNVLTSKGKTNTILLDWLSRNEGIYHVHHLSHSYSNSNYHTTIRGFSDEVLITNY